MILADGVRGIVGLINLDPGSFDSRREFGIEVRNGDVTNRLHEVAQHDWQNSRPLDLTDKGLLADVEDRYADSAVTLALDNRHLKHK